MAHTMDDLLAEAEAKASGLRNMSLSTVLVSNFNEENVRTQLKLAQEQILKVEAELKNVQQEKETAIKVSGIYRATLEKLKELADKEKQKLKDENTTHLSSIDELRREAEERERILEEKIHQIENLVAKTDGLELELQAKDKKIEILTTKVDDLTRKTVNAERNFKQMADTFLKIKLFESGNNLFEINEPKEAGHTNRSTNPEEEDTPIVTGNYSLRPGTRENVLQKRKFNQALGKRRGAHPSRKNICEDDCSQNTHISETNQDADYCLDAIYSTVKSEGGSVLQDVCLGASTQTEEEMGAMTSGTVADGTSQFIFESEMFKCKLCSGEYSTRDDFQAHYDSVHFKVRYECRQCKKAFNFASTYRRHYQSIHLGAKYNCSVCAREFNRKCSLLRHKTSKLGKCKIRSTKQE